MSALVDTPDYILTRSGRQFSFLSPKPDQIDIDDIAWALCHTNRWGGHTRRPVTVAQHCVVVSTMLRNKKYTPHLQLIGLLHDAAEAYLGDMPSPIKRHLPDYHAMELLVQDAIYKRFGIYGMSANEKQVLRLADIEAYRWEYRDLMEGDECTPPMGPRASFVPWTREASYMEYLDTFHSLMEVL